MTKKEIAILKLITGEQKELGPKWEKMGYDKWEVLEAIKKTQQRIRDKGGEVTEKTAIKYFWDEYLGGPEIEDEEEEEESQEEEEGTEI